MPLRSLLTQKPRGEQQTKQKEVKASLLIVSVVETESAALDAGMEVGSAFIAVVIAAGVEYFKNNSRCIDNQNPE